jgi:biopolymer transport protein ExbD
MGMSTGGGGEDEVMSEINTTPLIDVMLVLLIMFIITIPVQLHSVNMNMPTATSAPPSDEKPIVLKIDIDESGAVFWDGEQLPSRSVLEQKLLAISQLPKQPEVHLKPQKTTEYKHVAAVMASAQRIGVTNIGIVGNERFVQ